MPMLLLTDAESDSLRRLPLTYGEVGATAGPLPRGYSHVECSRRLDPSTDLDSAAEVLTTWQVQLRAGLSVRASTAAVRPDAVVLMRVAFLRIPCRVVYVIDEPDRRGFAYGTLPGHPEAGEESFVLDRTADGTITFTITAFSRPANVLTRLGGPVSRFAQRRMTSRYLAAIGP